MLKKVKRMLSKEELQANVREYKVKEEERKKAEMEENLLEVAEFLDATQKEILEQSKKGKTEYKFIRYENGYSRAFSEEIKMFFEEMGFDVDVSVSGVNNYQFDNELFFGLGSFSIAKTIKYTFVISWKE